MKKKKSYLASLALFMLIFSLPLFSQSFTLKQVLSSPFPSDLIASQSGDRVAWVFNKEGIRNIWIYDGLDSKARKITSYDSDDGQELGSIAFTPDGSRIVFVRGGSPNRGGWIPNPTSDPRGVERCVYIVDIETGKIRKLGNGYSPAVSPDGTRVVFVRNGKIYIAYIDTTTKSTQLFYARGQNTSPVWSSDGKRLAFVSYRDDHSYIGIYDFEENSIKWMAPGVDRDREVVWSPEGRRVAFFRFPGTMVEQPRSKELLRSFEIWIADVETGKGRRVWTCPDSSGGFAQYYPDHPLMWCDDDYLLFYSEHDGWIHLYSLSIKTGKAICLTPGKYIVEDCILSPDRKRVVFNSNKGDIDRRHLWSASIKGGSVKQLTKGDGLEWKPQFSSDGSHIFFLCSDALQPAAPAVMSVKGGKHRLIAQEAIPDDFPTDRLVHPKKVVFKAPDGLEIHGQLFVPKVSGEKKNRPAVIFMHGGPIRQMLLGWHMRGYYHRAYGMNQYLASRGYVVLSVNYRSGIGYGRAFRTAPNQGPRGASEYQDIVAAAKYLQTLSFVDPEKIGLWGGSYGGYLTALGLARDSELFRAGVDLHGVHDWSLRARRREGGGWQIYGDEAMRLAYKSSPVADVEFWYSPVLFIHGDDDRNVDFIQTTDLVQRLRREGKAHIELLVFPDEVHSFLCHKNWLRAYEACADFFDRFLK